MSRCCRVICWSVLVVLIDGSLAEGRTWTDVSGKFQIEAEYIQAKDGWVQLKKPDGKTLPIKIEKLCKSDQEYIDKRLSETAAEPEPEPVSEPAPEPAPEPVSTAKTGRFQTSFTERSTLTQAGSLLPRVLSPREMNELVNKIQSKLGKVLPKDSYFYNIENETYEVFVPTHYDGSLPFGLFVFIHSGKSGSPNKGWNPILTKHNMIFIGANKSGNDEDPSLRRIPLAVDAVYNMTKQYKIDPARVYISGNSGGGRAASWAAMAYSDVFTGGQYHVGANYYKNLSMGDGYIPGSIHLPSAQMFQHAKINNRYAFITADKDFNRPEMKKIHAAMQADGFRYATYLQVPGAGHGAPPPVWFEKGIVALDAPLKALAKGCYEKALKAIERKQLGPALLDIRSAAAHGHDQPFAADAKEKLEKLSATFDADIRAIEQAIEQRSVSDANRHLADFRKRWTAAGTADALRLATELKKARAKKP